LVELGLNRTRRAEADSCELEVWQSKGREFREGRRYALARAISLVENLRPGFEAFLHEIHADLGRARRIGITGPPGAGKSTLTAQLAQRYRSAEERVGIVAVDPTSPFTGGALLGDRIRMTNVATDPGVFIRSMATRGSLGGLATSSKEVADLLDAFGFERVITETVGVGQSELEIAETADTTVVVLVPESGDSIQAMKAGLMEIADVFVINKADRPGADRLAQELELMLHLRLGDAQPGGGRAPRREPEVGGEGRAPPAKESAEDEGRLVDPRAEDRGPSRRGARRAHGRPWAAIWGIWRRPASYPRAGGGAWRTGPGRWSTGSCASEPGGAGRGSESSGRRWATWNRGRRRLTPWRKGSYRTRSAPDLSPPEPAARRVLAVPYLPAPPVDHTSKAARSRSAARRLGAWREDPAGAQPRGGFPTR
jgi:LAO/AO transport system ATPase